MNENIVWRENPFCEHCGNLEPFTAIFDDDYISWCLYCALTNGDIVEKDLEEGEKVERELQKEYFQKRANEL